jgi:hypothetical protein
MSSGDFFVAQVKLSADAAELHIHLRGAPVVGANTHTGDGIVCRARPTRVFACAEAIDQELAGSRREIDAPGEVEWVARIEGFHIDLGPIGDGKLAGERRQMPVLRTQPTPFDACPQGQNAPRKRCGKQEPVEQPARHVSSWRASGVVVDSMALTVTEYQYYSTHASASRGFRNDCLESDNTPRRCRASK